MRRKKVDKPNKTASNEIDVRAGARVKSRRLQLKMSQTGLADCLGVTFQQVQKYEKGINRIGSSRMQQIANALHMPPADFFDDPLANADDAAAGTEILTGFLSSRDGIALMQAIGRIESKSVRHAIAKLLEDQEG